VGWGGVGWGVLFLRLIQFNGLKFSWCQLLEPGNIWITCIGVRITILQQIHNSTWPVGLTLWIHPHPSLSTNFQLCPTCNWYPFVPLCAEIQHAYMHMCSSLMSGGDVAADCQNQKCLSFLPTVSTVWDSMNEPSILPWFGGGGGGGGGFDPGSFLYTSPVDVSSGLGWNNLSSLTANWEDTQGGKRYKHD
jgi:hypothetical protein